MQKSKKRVFQNTKIVYTDNPKFLLFTLVILILLLSIVIRLYLTEKEILLAPEGTRYSEGNYGESDYAGTATRQQTDDQRRDGNGNGYVPPRRPINQTNQTRQNQTIPQQPITIDGEEPSLRRISLADEPKIVEINDGEKIIFDIEDTSDSYEFTFEILTNEIIMRTLNKEFNINKNEVVEIIFGTTKIYVGIKELETDKTSIVLGLDKAKVEEIVLGRVSTKFYFTLTIAILSIAITTVFFLLYRALKKQKMASTSTPQIQRSSQFQGQFSQQFSRQVPAKTQQFKKT